MFKSKMWHLLWVATLLGACGDEPSTVEGPVRMWDTLSVDRFVITADAAEVIDEASPWTLSSEPVVEIGERGGGDDLFGVIHHMTMMSTGELAVVDPQSGFLYLFDSDGYVQAVAGGYGDGPGEFRLPFWVGECAPDSVFVYDAGNGRVSVFSSAGEFERSFDLIEPGGIPVDPPRCSENERLVALGRPSWEEASEVGRFVAQASVVLFDAVGRSDRLIGSFPAQEYINTGTQPLAPPLFRATVFEISEDRIYVGYPDRYEIGVATTGGELQAVFGFDLPPRVVTAADAQGATEQLVGSLEGEVARRFTAFAQEHMPGSFPYFDRILLSSTRDVWVRRHPSSVDDTHRWDIFGGSDPHQYLGFLQVPSTFEPFAVSDQRVAGRWVGEFDEHYIRVYVLESRRAEPTSDN